MGGGGPLGAFTRSRARRFEDPSTPTTFADVAGIDDAKEELAEIVDYLRRPERYEGRADAYVRIDAPGVWIELSNQAGSRHQRGLLPLDLPRPAARLRRRLRPQTGRT